VANGRLREDLLYRLNVFPIALPPLRERGDDVVLLAQSFLDTQNREAEGAPKAWSAAALARLRTHSWPGNVRELRNVVQRAYIMAADEIEPSALPLASLVERSSSSLVVQVGTPIDEAERRLILATLEHCAGDKKTAAGLLKISLKTLYNRLNVYGVK
jgi:DNA-binding NtrC family response regulator